MICKFYANKFIKVFVYNSCLIRPSSRAFGSLRGSPEVNAKRSTSGAHINSCNFILFFSDILLILNHILDVSRLNRNDIPASLL